MSERGENGESFDDWQTLVSSPRDFSSSFVSVDSDSKSLSESLMVERADDEDDHSSVNVDKKFEQGGPGMVPDVPGVRTGGSIAERRAAKCGFNAARINTARFRATSPLASPAARSPYLTIPPGISPSTLLDSPIMLPNSQAQPSPTTGTFPLSPLHHEKSMLNPVTSSGDGTRCSNVGPSFRFKSHGSPVSLPYFPGLENQSLGASVDYQAVPHVQPPDFEFAAEFPKEKTNNCATDSPNEVEHLNEVIVSANSIPLQTFCSNVASDQVLQQKEPIQGEDAGTHYLLEGDQKEVYPPAGVMRTSEDVYNWRKYGQKQVKGSEYPRSYYKCTHPNCQVKKKVERSHDGQITEIIYKGSHNHSRPQPSRRSAPGSGFSFNEMEMGEGSGSCVKVEGGLVWRNIQPGSKEIKFGSDLRVDRLERTSSTSVVTELSDPLSTTQGKSMGVFESAETPELSSTLASHDDDEDGATQGSISIGDEADDDESESKRRKKENCLVEPNLSSRAVREPRVVVQIESEVDILDDGYRWRKYGQKVVKGNPNPRSYYKCTSAGCSVRKHVERASHNLKSVITTYEGKHNHEVPAAKNSNHANSNGGNLPPPAPNAQPNLILPSNTNVPKPESHVQEFVQCFERKPDFSNEFLRPSFLKNFGNDVKFGAPSIYQMKYHSLQNSMTYGSFGLNPNHGEANHANSMANAVPDFPISLPLSLPQSASLALAGFDFSNHGKPVGSVHPFIAGQRLKENDIRYIRPKQEQKDDGLYDPCLPVDHANPPSSSSMYYGIAGSFPT
ncbi:WRKY transcription factor SUSIBA2-like [Malania oleifera]|uniref:WRKY transcription factor SUSIBA2-like n=1 Tax=Malania oleifera TaxID=397392 RepID=UPI0025AE48D7|nr:WRKY transcription factor SUSIBA2-like [Malania oleifera]